MDNNNHIIPLSPIIDVQYESAMVLPTEYPNYLDNEAMMELNPAALHIKPLIDRDSGVKRQRRVSGNGVDEPRGVGGRGQGWKEAWVVHLIRARGDLHEEFMKPPRQGVDLWSKVYSRVLIACPKFDKNAESCRKKWQMIYKLYKEDKASERVLVDRDPKKCNWFHLIDEYMNNSTHIAANANEVIHDPNGGSQEVPELVNEIHTDAVLVKVFNTNGIDAEANIITPSLKKCKESKMDAKVDEFLTNVNARVDKMVETSTQFLTKFDYYEREKVVLLNDLNETLKSFMNFLKE